MRRSTVALALFASLVGTGVAGRAAAQTPVDAPIASSALLLRLRSPRATLDDAREVIAALVDRGTTVRTQGFDLLARHYKDASKAFEQGRERLRKRLSRTVPQVQQQLQRGAAAEIDDLRDQALAISRTADLTKQRIQDEIDPRLERLRALVLPTPTAVLEHDAALASQLAELREEHDRLVGWFNLYVDTERRLAEDPAAARHIARHEPLPAPPAVAVLDDDIDLLCLMALPMAGRDRKALEDNDALRADTEPEEFVGTLELNRIRIALGLNTLRIDPKLGDAARGHSDDMRRLGFFSHTSPVQGKKSPSDRAALAGTSGGAENIASGQNSGRGAIRAWWYSPGHHKNMLGGHARTGLGRSESLWTQMFGG